MFIDFEYTLATLESRIYTRRDQIPMNLAAKLIQKINNRETQNKLKIYQDKAKLIRKGIWKYGTTSS